MKPLLDPCSDASAPPTYHVLIVDDEIGWRRLLTTCLEALANHEDNGLPGARLRCQGVASGRELLAHLKAGLPCDAVVLDLRMPGLHGLAVLESLRLRHPNLPVVVHSGVIEQLWESQRRGQAENPDVVAEVTKGMSSPDQVNRELRRLLGLVTRALRRGAGAAGTTAYRDLQRN